MLASAIPDVHKWLVSNGYVRVTTETKIYAYDGILQCNQISAPVRLSFHNLNFQELPEIHIRAPKPEAMCRPLSHVDYNNKLCYLDAEKYRVDPYRPVQTIVNLLEQARIVLTESLTGKNENDVGYEFSAYWEWESFGVILSQHDSGSFTKFNYLEYTKPTGRKTSEIVVGESQEIITHNKWRKGKLIFNDSNTAIWIKLNTTVLLPEEGPFPPKNFHDFNVWLSKVDSNASKLLIKKLGTKEGACSPILIVLESQGSFVGFEVRLAEKLQTATQNPSRYTKQLVRDKGGFGTKINRSKLDNFTPKYLASRSLLGSNLIGKRIVLIGCGTIGGNLARLLVQSGAGLNSGELILYDNEILMAGNVGRHYLDATYLKENKAEACEHKLKTEFPSAKIQSRPKLFTEISDVCNSISVDIIIDATGREPFSLALNAKAVDRHMMNKPCPDILFVWIDGNGYCGRTLYYNGKGGCYRCLQNLSGHDRFPPLKSGEELVPVSYKCGESFVPYPPSISVQTAGMGLDALLDWAAKKPEPHFRHQIFNKKAQKYKSQHLVPEKNCPACQKKSTNTQQG